MPEQNSARERLDAAVEAKELSSFPRLKRAIQRSWFVAILFTVALPLLVLRASQRGFDAGILVVTAVDMALVIGVWWFSFLLIKCFRGRQWDRLNGMLGVGARIAFGIALLSALSALASIIVLQQITSALISALVTAGLFVWRNDYIRAREDLVAMLAERGVQSTSAEPIPIDPALLAAEKKRQRLWIAASVVLLAVLAGVSWLAIESGRTRSAAQEQERMAKVRAGEEQMIAAYEAEKIATAERDRKLGIATLSGHESHVMGVAFSPDGRVLVSGSSEHTVRVWDVATAKSTATFKGHESVVTSVAFFPGGRTVASGSWDTTVRVWDIASSKTIATLSGHERHVNSIAIARDGRTLASASQDDTVRLWDIASGKTIATLSGHNESVYSVAFSPNGRTVASGSEDKTVRLWDVASGKTVATLSGHGATVNSVAFSPDGRTLASGSRDKTVRLWDVASGKSLATFDGHEDIVSSVVFSPDGRTLASGSEDRTVRLWNVTSGKTIATLSGHEGTVSGVAFSADGRTVASGSSDKTVRLWPVSPP